MTLLLATYFTAAVCTPQPLPADNFAQFSDVASRYEAVRDTSDAAALSLNQGRFHHISLCSRPHPKFKWVAAELISHLQ